MSVLDQIQDLLETRDLTIAEAGRYWQHCEFTQERIAKIDRHLADLGYVKTETKVVFEDAPF